MMAAKSFPSRYAGICAKCGGEFGRGAPIKARWVYDRGVAKPVKMPGEYVHEVCPKVYVDPDTGEIINLLQQTLDGAEVNYDEAVRQSQEPVGAFRVRRRPTKIHPGQGLMFDIPVDKKTDHA